MIGVYSVSEIREAERRAIDCGENEDALIERAATKLFDEAMKFEFDEAVVFVGGGNNGSDALSVALLLSRAGRKVRVATCSDKRNGYVEARLSKLAECGVKVQSIMCDIPPISRKNLVIDGIFGIGLNAEVRGAVAETMKKINASGASVLSVDVPSGLNADTGKVMSMAIEADVTVTFSGIKQGLIIGEGRNHTGKIVVADIGIGLPEPGIGITEKEDVTLTKRKTVSNKGNYGNVKIIAGSPTMIGASLLAHESACASLRSGCGYAVLCVPESLVSVYQSRVKEEMLFFLPDANGKILYDERVLDKIMTKASCIVIGMGLGVNADVIKIIRYLAANFEGTLVIDGDGLNALASDLNAVEDHKCELILTPHVAEFMRLSADDGLMPDTERTRALAERLDAVIAMKSATTVISDGKKIALNITGTPAMAKAGSGDVLAGMIGALSVGADPFAAAVRACYFFGKAGSRAATIRGEYSVLASDIVLLL